MSNVGLIILAAGASSRMGTPKQLLRYDGTTLLGHAVSVASRSTCRPIALVLGAAADEIRPHFESPHLEAQIVLNNDWIQGLSSSIRCGIRALNSIDPDVQAAIIMTCDQPFVTTDLLDRIVDQFKASGNAIVASEYADTLGTPALFHRSLFDELLALSGDKGAKSIILRHQNDVSPIPFPLGSKDVDTLDDYHQVSMSGR